MAQDPPPLRLQIEVPPPPIYTSDPPTLDAVAIFSQCDNKTEVQLGSAPVVLTAASDAMPCNAKPATPRRAGGGCLHLSLQNLCACQVLYEWEVSIDAGLGFDPRLLVHPPVP